MKRSVVLSILLLSSLDHGSLAAGRRGASRPAALRNGLGQPDRGHASAAGRLREPRRLDASSSDDSVASFARSREQQLWGEYVGKLVYRGTGHAADRRRCGRPSRSPFPRRSTASTSGSTATTGPGCPTRPRRRSTIAVLLRGQGGQAIRVPLGSVRWQEWWVMHRRLTAGADRPARRRRAVRGHRGRRRQEQGGPHALLRQPRGLPASRSPPLKFEPRPERGIDLLPGQGTGHEHRPGQAALPHARRDDPARQPDDRVQGRTWSNRATRYAFHYRGDDGAARLPLPAGRRARSAT